MPKVSVIIPTHERPMFLIRALKSVRAQTFTDYEIIVISNGESYQDRAINRSTAQFYGAIFIELDKGNVSLARNAGIMAAKGEWVAFLDDDDEWLPQKLEKQMNICDEYDLICCDFVEIHNDNKVFECKNRVPEGFSFVKALNYDCWWPIQSSILVKTRVAKRTLYDHNMWAAEDVDFTRRIAWCHKIHQMQEILVKYHMGHNSVMNKIRCRWPHFIALIKYYKKIRKDTPESLRDTIPNIWTFFGPRLKWLQPYFIRQPRKSFLRLFSAQ